MMSLKKVVLARRSTVQLDNRLSAAQLLKASYLNNHHSFHFLLSLDSKHSFMALRQSVCILVLDMNFIPRL